MKKLVLTGVVLCAMLSLVACQSELEETMVLLDEKISAVHIAHSEGFGDMNQEIIFTFQDKKTVDLFETAITTAIKKSEGAGSSLPDYDLMVEYEDGYPIHAIHLWLGEKNESSFMKYITDETEVYETTPKMTNKLREFILSEE